MTIDDLKGLALTLSWRLVLSALLGAILTVGAVYFVVQMSIAGIQTAIETTNKRIDDVHRRIDSVETNIVSRTNERIDSLERLLRLEFGQTRELMRRGDTGDPTRNFAFLDLERTHLAVIYSQKPINFSDILNAENYSLIAQEIKKEAGEKLSLVNMFPLVDNAQFKKLSEKGVKWADLIFLSRRDLDESIIAKWFSSCLRLSKSIDGTIIANVSGAAKIFESGAIGCPVVEAK